MAPIYWHNCTARLQDGKVKMGELTIQVLGPLGLSTERLLARHGLHVEEDGRVVSSRSVRVLVPINNCYWWRDAP